MKRLKCVVSGGVAYFKNKKKNKKKKKKKKKKKSMADSSTAIKTGRKKNVLN